MRVLVLNAGSSSLKTSVVGEPGDVTVSRAELERPAHTGWSGALADALHDAGRIDAIGHRVVHGGAAHIGAMLISETVVDELEELRALAPLHNGPALEVISAAREAFPELPQVACFDTAFHATLTPAAYVYPLPYAWYTDWGVRRFGFHGLSVSWSVERAAALLDRPADQLRLVVAHLGSGCSVTAVDGGCSVHTSMGMTPLEGLMMGTRSGSVDPGMLLELLDARRLTRDEMQLALQRESGLLGVSGISSDLREVQRAARRGKDRARLALEMFARRAAAGIAAAASALPDLDALVFTAGIGEHDADMRDAICARLAVLGVPAELATASGDAVLSPADASVQVLRVEAREDLVIGREVAGLLG